MIVDETIQKLIELRLATMAQAFRQMLESPQSHDLSFEDKLGMLVDREWLERDNRRVARRTKEAKLPIAANIEEVVADPARGIDKSVLRSLAACPWIKAKQNIIIHGATGVGKSSSALRSHKRPAVTATVRSTSAFLDSSTISASRAPMAPTRPNSPASRASTFSSSTTSSSRR